LHEIFFSLKLETFSFIFLLKKQPKSTQCGKTEHEGAKKRMMEKELNWQKAKVA
jgi:hypothetical protein